MNILVTGGCGFVGTNLVAQLIAAGLGSVTVLDNETLGRREHLGDLKVKFLHGDVRDRVAVDAALDGIDTVIHLAADTRVIDSIEDPVCNFEVNVAGTVNLLEGMRKKGIRTLVNASTGGAILGEVAPPVHEEMVPRPVSPYGASKLAVEGYCSAYSACYGMRAASLRFSNVYGPGSLHKGSVVAAFFRQILSGNPIVVYGDGTQVRDFIFVEDLCAGIIAALRSEVTGVFQLASGVPVTINALLDAISSVVNPTKVTVIRQSFRTGEIYATYCDISKARLELGFNPKTDLTVGLQKTWQWFNSQ